MSHKTRYVVLAGIALVALASYYLTKPGRSPGSGPARMAAPTPPASAPESVFAARPAVERAAVQGMVRDWTTGAGVAGVTVTLEPSDTDVGGTHAVTDARGMYELTVAPGMYMARVVGVRIVLIDAQELVAVGSAGAPALDFRVLRMAEIHGRVVDGVGEPVTGAQVAYRSRGAAGGDQDLARVWDIGQESVASGSDGAFVLVAPPGVCELYARAPSAPESSILMRWIEPGATVTGVEIVMDAGARVLGRVVDASGAPVVGADILAYASDRGEVRAGLSGADGRFALDAVVPGRIQLEAHAEGFAPSTVAVVHVAAGATSPETTLVVEPALGIQGRVVDDTGVPVADAQVRALPAMGRAEPGPVRTDGSGQFSLTGLGRGPYAVRASAPSLSPTVERGVIAPARDVELVLVRAGAVFGRVRDEEGAPVSDFWLRLDPELSSGAPVAPGMDSGLEPGVQPSRRFLDPRGEYLLGGVRPGTYAVTFFAAGMAPITISKVAVPSAGSVEVSTTLGAGATITGRVEDAATGQPIRGAGVRVSTGNEAPAGYTRADGAFTITDVAPGRRTLEVNHPAYIGRYETGVDVERGRATDVRVALERLRPGADQTFEFAGIGAVLAIEGEVLVVRELLPNSPAEVAGLAPGDRVTHIDGQRTGARTMAENIEAIRGIVGTVVRLTVARQDSVFERDVVRGNVRFQPPAPAPLDGE